MKTIHIAIADIHVGSKLGLCPPEALIDLGGAYKPNPWQKWMWDRWEEAWDWVDEKIKEIKPDYTHLSLVGDLCDVDIKGRSDQIWSRNFHTIVDVTTEVLEPIVNKVDTLMVIKGTEAHNGLSNQLEDAIAKNFDNHVPCEETGEPAWWSADIELGGVLFNMNHHGKLGYQQHTKRNGMYSLRQNIIGYRVDHYEAIPDVAVRAHLHQFYHTFLNEPCVIVQLPGWQLKTAFINRKDSVDTLPQVGVCLFECEDGHFTLHANTYTMERSKPWRPTKSTIKTKSFLGLHLKS